MYQSELVPVHKRSLDLTVLIYILCPHACIYCMHTKYYQAISKIPKFLLGVNVSWICLSLKRKFWKQMFIYIVCHNNVVKSFLKLHFLLPYICIFMRFLLFLNYFWYDCMNASSNSLYSLKSTQYKKLAPNALLFTYKNWNSCKSHEKNETKNIRLLFFHFDVFYLWFARFDM